MKIQYVNFGDNPQFLPIDLRLFLRIKDDLKTFGWVSVFFRRSSNPTQCLSESILFLTLFSYNYIHLMSLLPVSQAPSMSRRAARVYWFCCLDLSTVPTTCLRGRNSDSAKLSKGLLAIFMCSSIVLFSFQTFEKQGRQALAGNLCSQVHRCLGLRTKRGGRRSHILFVINLFFLLHKQREISYNRSF